MSNDLQAQISTRIGNTVSEIGKVNAAVTQLHSSTDKNNQAHKRFQDTASNAFKSSHMHASNFNNTMKEVGHALGLLGGEAGHMAHMLGNVGKMSETGGVAIVRTLPRGRGAISRVRGGGARLHSDNCDPWYRI